MLASWRAGGRPTPYFSECFEPERTTLTLPLKRVAEAKADHGRRAMPAVMAKQLLAEYLTSVIFARAGQISAALGISLARVRYYLNEMRLEGTVVSEGNGKNTVYKLRERAGL